MVSAAERERLVSEDPGADGIIRPYLRGRDVQRWVAEWGEEYMIFARRGIDIGRFPSVARHLESFREGLEPRPVPP